MTMNTAGLLQFMRRYRLAVQASVSAMDAPQAAVVGFAVTDLFEIVFDTLDSSRKGQNLRRNNRIALVIGGFLVLSWFVHRVVERPVARVLKRGLDTSFARLRSA